MRHARIIALALLISGCGGSYLDTRLTPGEHDLTQDGGNAGRSAPVGIRVSALVHAWDASLQGPAGSAAILRLGDNALIPLVGGIVDILDLRTGEGVGRINVEMFSHGSPAVSGGRLFLPTVGPESLLQAIHLEDCTVRWTAKTEPVEGAVCLHEDAVFIAGSKGNVMCFGVNDSVPRWTRRLPGNFRAGPVATDSVLVLAGENGDVTGLSVRDGHVLWRHATGAAFLAGPAIEGRRVAAVNRNGHFITADVHTGVPGATVDLGEPVYVAPAISGGTVIVALSGGDVLWLSAIDGKDARRVATDRLPGSQPIVADNGVVLLARDGTLMFIPDDASSPVELAKLEYRSAVRPLVTEHGVLLVDEEGNARMYRWKKDGGLSNAGD